MGAIPDIPPLPRRVELQTCIGCGARDRVRECVGDCVEVRLDLVAAEAHERRVAQRDALAGFAGAAAAALAPLAAGGAAPGEDEARLRWPALRDAAAAALAAAPDTQPDDPPPVATTWWCATCERIEAPQPCIGVCVRRPESMVSAQLYASVDAEAQALRARAGAAQALLRLVATVQPRDGHWAQTWAALAERVRAA
jgi:hypothetical protein